MNNNKWSYVVNEILIPCVARDQLKGSAHSSKSVNNETVHDSFSTSDSWTGMKPELRKTCHKKVTIFYKFTLVLARVPHFTVRFSEVTAEHR